MTGFRTSSFSHANGNCTEVGFRKSSASVNDGACAEVGYRKSSRSESNGHCAEVGFRSACANSECAEVGYRASSSCNVLSCAEVGVDDYAIVVRDTKQKHLGDARTVLAFPPSAWRTFVGRLKEQQEEL